VKMSVQARPFCSTNLGMYRVSNDWQTGTAGHDDYPT
jgi:hypothetical protein